MGQKNDDKDTNGITDFLETHDIKSMIYAIRGQQVMLDSDLAALYGYEVIKLNQQGKRNIKRFPEDFMFQLTKAEVDSVKSQFVTSPSPDFYSGQEGGRRKPPSELLNRLSGI